MKGSIHWGAVPMLDRNEFEVHNDVIAVGGGLRQSKK